MTPMRFEELYAPMWNEFSEELRRAQDGKPVDGALLAARYRRVCEQLTLAQSRAYPIHLTARLETLAQDAHQIIYRRQDFGLARLARLLLVDLPQAVRAQRAYVLASVLLFVVPTVLAYLFALHSPDFILRIVDAKQVRNFESMYADGKGQLGRMIDAGGDWKMFGFYIFNNIGVGFRCFAGGIFGGIGSAFFLIFNGLLGGAVAGHLQRVGLGHNFWPFVVTHCAFEITGIVLSGAAGLRLGLAWLMPGRLGRVESLRSAAGEAMLLIYATIFLLVLAAGFEAFWSSAAWIAPPVKFGVAAVCWSLVFGWFSLAGRKGLNPRKAVDAR
ncbi:MAG TPA: stage II sporulation protein M [Burkholderiaceae bacterium]|jgi:uncharacterized membrane protein SpoIIM required for sporulation